MQRYFDEILGDYVGYDLIEVVCREAAYRLVLETQDRPS
jgi:hypothetical protein